jgi:hypothetical protein
MSLVFLGLQFYEIATALLGFAAFCTAWVSGYFGSSFGRMQATFSLIGRLHNIRPIFFYREMVTSLSVNRFRPLVTPSGDRIWVVESVAVTIPIQSKKAITFLLPTTSDTNRGRYNFQ